MRANLKKMPEDICRILGEDDDTAMGITKRLSDSGYSEMAILRRTSRMLYILEGQGKVERDDSGRVTVWSLRKEEEE